MKRLHRIVKYAMDSKTYQAYQDQAKRDRDRSKQTADEANRRLKDAEEKERAAERNLDRARSANYDSWRDSGKVQSDVSALQSEMIRSVEKVCKSRSALVSAKADLAEAESTLKGYSGRNHLFDK